ncbi:hypothetical protein FSB78_15635 [Sphingomonas ginsenosidivorax]|uniref:Uncharacterized protein n=1 Tax=Sphingomonas ginsenosidivorax TaxID=862135 RepID=A0A5C6UIL9_9SPHN|nr:hypothetical protein [Sphingomonas ginsenosidivorax]TXC72214.1 hypothetical protein FSB78_15635 [Sphingomonas ginsenosidivorax]
MSALPKTWLPISDMPGAMRDGRLLMLLHGGRQVVASWSREPPTDKGFWWNGEVSEETGRKCRVENPTCWSEIDLDAYRDHHRELIRVRGA